MDKYLAVFKITWEQALVYRLNFVLWRVRTVLQLLMVYFIWWTVFQSQSQVFGYSQASILTYILVAAIIRAVVLSSRTIDVSGQINEGSVVNFLIKPLNFIYYYLSRDFADKLVNTLFAIGELTIMFYLLKPQFIFQTNPLTILLFVLAVLLGLFLYFSISFVIGLMAFWVENSWGPFFLIMIMLEGLGGGLFPIDILPKNVAATLLSTPFPYLVYFPAKVYLGTLTTMELVKGFSILTFWVMAMWFLMTKVLQAGLRFYTAEGH